MAETKGFYVGVKEPVSLRRKLLESSKGIIQYLKDYENLKLIREEKHKEIVEFKNKIDEMTALLSELKEHLPKKELQGNTYTKEGTEKNSKRKKVKIENSEIERLETDLAEIESRLSSM